MPVLPPAVKSGGEPTLRALMLVHVTLAANPTLAEPGNAPPIKVNWGMQVLRVPNTGVRARQVHMHCTLGDDEQRPQVAYTGQMLVACEQHFTGPAQLGDDEMDQVAAWTSANMLVGMVRSQVHSLTAVGPYPPVLLNMVDLGRLVTSAKVVSGDGKLLPLYPPNDAASLEHLPAQAGALPATGASRRRRKPKG